MWLYEQLYVPAQEYKYTHTFSNNTKQQHRAVIAHASNRMNDEMNRNGGSHRVYLAYQKHRRMTGSDLQARNTEHGIT